MSWPVGNWVSESEDYRAPGFGQRVAAAAVRGVIVCGTSRSGKTTLLNRLREKAAVGGATEIIDISLGHEVAMTRLEAVIGSPASDARGVLLDEAQRVVEWPLPLVKRLREALHERPFVMAAWPSLFESAPPKELQWLHEMSFLQMPPFGLEEAARMARRANGAAPDECDAAIIEALHRATAGHPNLLARLCAFLIDDGASPLRAPTEDDLRTFLDFAMGHNDPFRAIFNSLPRRMQQIITDFRSGSAVRLDALKPFGIASGTPASFAASLFSLAWSVERPPAAAAGAPALESRAPRPAPPPAVKWIHLSDLHFGAGEAAHRFNQGAVIEAIRRDVKKLPWKPDFIFVTGDIAFSGRPQQYEAAAAWLKEIAAMAGVGVEALRMVPGNHDADRSLAGAPGVADAHTTIRKDPARLDVHLSDKASRKSLASRLKAYASFVKGLAPTHPATEGSVLDWCHSVDAPDGAHGRLWIAGICTVWVSNADDNERKMVIAERQLQALNQVEETDLLLLLTHHPPGWLHPRAEDLLLDRMSERAPHIHLCGHVHSASARVLRGLGVPRESMRLVAGAAHGDATETHGYSWGGIRWNAARERWELGWSPRVFVKGQGIRVNRDRYELEDDDFAWEGLRIGWAPPEGRAAP